MMLLVQNTRSQRMSVAHPDVGGQGYWRFLISQESTNSMNELTIFFALTRCLCCSLESSVSGEVVGGLQDQHVVACAASRYFSLSATSTGQVWAFGACYNGSLGSQSSWSTSAQVATL
jgi:hypothetical protein